MFVSTITWNFLDHFLTTKVLRVFMTCSLNVASHFWGWENIYKKFAKCFLGKRNSELDKFGQILWKTRGHILVTYFFTTLKEKCSTLRLKKVDFFFQSHGKRPENYVNNIFQVIVIWFSTQIKFSDFKKYTKKQQSAAIMRT